jgi:hypothetical protein
MSQVNIPIAKGGKGAILSVDPSFFSDLPEEVQLEIIGAGLEKFLNAGMSSSDKFPAPTKLDGEALESAKTAALAKAEANLGVLKQGKIKAFKYVEGKAKAKSSSAEDRQITSEALRLAKVVLKNKARAQGIKPLSAVPASKWTELATQLIASDPKFLAEAKENILSRNKETVDMDLTALNLIDPAKIKKSVKTSDDGTLSAKQAGLPKASAKGKVPPKRPDSIKPTPDALAGLVASHTPAHRASH